MRQSDCGEISGAGKIENCFSVCNTRLRVNPTTVPLDRGAMLLHWQKTWLLGTVRYRRILRIISLVWPLSKPDFIDNSYQSNAGCSFLKKNRMFHLHQKGKRGMRIWPSQHPFDSLSKELAPPNRASAMY